MSIETLLLLAVFVLLPLIQQLLRAARARGEEEPAPSAGPPAGPPAAPAPVPPPVPPRTRPRAPYRAPAGERGPMLQRPAATARAADVHTGARRRAANVSFRSLRDLRRAVVQMTILGSCRAKNPYREPEAE